MFENVEDTYENDYVDFSRMRVGARKVDNALINLGSYQKVNKNYGDKTFILRAITRHDYATMREISKFFYESSGIYYRLCEYLATLYRYDWYVTPYLIDLEKTKEPKVLGDFSKVLLYLDNSDIKTLLADVASDIIVEGVYYGIILDFGDRFGFQKLPQSYCRSRFTSGNLPVVEFNLQFFDTQFINPQYKLQVLKMFPKDIQQAYIQFKQGKLQGDYPGDTSYWYPLDPATSIKLSLTKYDFPIFIGTIPSIIDLDEAQGLDRKKTLQQLLKIIVQKLPVDKDGVILCDVDEGRDIHNNAVQMLSHAIGVDVLTTFADVTAIDTKDRNSSTTKDDLEKVERTVYNNAGISRNIFNADGNLAIANAILADEASIRALPLKFSSLLTRILQKFNRKNHYEFRLNILETTQFNYKEMSKMYKEQAQMGYSKMLPQIALGESQSSILATFTFENEVLHLAEKMVPPQLSSTMSGKQLGRDGQSNQNKTQEEKSTGGRPEKPDTEKSDKTLKNKESM